MCWERDETEREKEKKKAIFHNAVPQYVRWTHRSLLFYLFPMQTRPIEFEYLCLIFVKNIFFSVLVFVFFFCCRTKYAFGECVVCPYSSRIRAKTKMTKIFFNRNGIGVHTANTQHTRTHTNIGILYSWWQGQGIGCRRFGLPSSRRSDCDDYKIRIDKLNMSPPK